jgi:hypothetical protein
MKVSAVKRKTFIRAIPAGKLMNVRITGIRRVAKTVISPYFENQRSAQSISFLVIRT